MDESSFRIWDKEKSGLLDAFEIFSGLIIYSKALFKEKTKFLFEMFDLNEENFITLTELEFLLNTTLTSIFKITNMDDEIIEKEITNFVSENFFQDVNLKFSDFYKWSLRNKYIWRFMKILKQEIPSKIITNYRISVVKIETKNKNKENKDNKNKNQIIQKKEKITNENELSCQNVENIKKKILDFVNCIEEPVLENRLKIEGFELNHIYGIKTDNKNNHLLYQTDENSLGISEKLFYVSNKIIIIFYPKLNSQKFYFDHKNNISAFSLSNNNLMASADYSKNEAKIHVWDIHSIETLNIFTGFHRNKIRILRFINNNKFLVSISSKKSSFVFIHNLLTSELFYSFNEENYINTIVLVKNKKICTNFFLMSKKKISLIENDDVGGKFKKTDIWLDKLNNLSDINYGISKINDNGDLILITAHVDGKLILWKNQKFQKIIRKYKFSILKIALNKYGVFLLLENCRLIFWKGDFEEEKEKIDFSKKKPFNPDFENFIDIIGSGSKIFLLTDLGDIIQYHFKYQQEKITLLKNEPSIKLKHRKERIKSIFKINFFKKNQKCIQTDNSFKIFFSQGLYEIYVLNLTENEFTLKYKFNSEILFFDIFYFKKSIHFMILLKNNELIHLKDDKIIEKTEFTKNPLKMIFGIDFENLFILDDQNRLYRYNSKNGKFLDFFSITNFLNKNETLKNMMNVDKKKICFSTNKNNYYLLDTLIMKEFTNLETKEKKILDFLKIDFFVKNEAYSKIFFSFTTATIFTLNNNLCYFPDFNYLLKNTYKKLSFNNNKIDDFYFDSDLKKLIIFGNNSIFVFNAITSESSINEKEININENLKKELNFIKNKKRNIIDDNKYYSDSLTYFKYDTKNKDTLKTIPKLFEDDINNTGMVYKKMKYSTTDERIFNKRYPPLRINLKYIYGLESKLNRNSVIYAHKYNLKHSRNPVKVPKKISKINLDTSISKEFIYSKYKKKYYDCYHTNCDRFILHFNSKNIILTDSQTKKQRHYKGHKNKVTCIALTESKKIAASGETEINNSCSVHLWNTETNLVYHVFTLKVITQCFSLKFSSEDYFLFVLGKNRQNIFVVEVFDWKRKIKILNKLLTLSPVFGLIPNIYKKNEFTVYGFDYLQRFFIEGRFLKIRETFQNTEKEPLEITAICYFYYLLGNEADHDFMLGTASGAIGLLTFGKYKEIHKNAHFGQINCLKITDMLNKVVVIISAGEDGLIKFWNARIEIIKVLNLNNDPKLWEYDNSINHSAQSLDTFTCWKNEKRNIENNNQINENGNSKILLVCTRNNEILEIKLSTEYKKIIEKEDENEKTLKNNLEDKKNIFKISKKNIIIETLLFDYNLICKFNSNDKDEKTLNALIHKKHPILITYEQNNYIFIWNYETNFLFTKKLNSKILFIKIYQKSNILVVLTEDNKISIFKMEIKKKNFEIKIKNLTLCFEKKLNLEEKVQNMLIGKRNKIEDDNEFFTKFELILIIQPFFKKKSEEFIKVFEIKFSHKKKDLSSFSINLKDFSVRKTGKIFLPDFLKKKQMNVLSNDLKIKISNILLSSEKTYLSIKIIIKKTQILKNQENEEIINLVFDLEELKNIENFLEIDDQFSNKYSYQDKQINLELFPKINSEKENLKNLKKKYDISCQKYYKDYLILGTQQGVLLLSKYIEQNDYKESNQMKIIQGHSEPIDKILVSHDKNFIFTISKNSNSILQWKIEEIDHSWELDYQIYPIEFRGEDFIEYEKKDEFFENLHNSIHKRKEIQHLKKICEKKNELEISIFKIIGRKAFNRRNCLEATYNKKLIFCSGTLLCILGISEYDEKKEQNFTQDFLMLEEQMDDSFTCPEISNFVLTKDKRFVCIGTTETHSCLYFWEISSKQFFHKLKLSDILAVQYISFSFNSKFLVCIGLNNSFRQTLFFISLKEKPEILSKIDFKYSCPHKIKGIEFLPNDNFSFMTYGEQHIVRWYFNAGLLLFNELPLKGNKIINDFFIINSNEENNMKPEDLKKLNVVFLSFFFLDDNIFIMGGNDGFLYIWKNFKIIKKKIGHLNASILCLCQSPFEKNFFVSGGSDGTVNLWEIQNTNEKNDSHVIETIFRYQIYSKSQKIFGVQSVQFRKENIIAGSQNGDIFVLELPDNTTFQTSLKESKDLIKPIYNCFDDDSPLFCDFSYNNKIIFSSSKMGTLCIYRFENSILLYRQYFQKKIVNMIVMNTNPYLILGFEDKVSFYNVLNIEKGIFTNIESFTLKCNLSINDLKITMDEKLLAMSIYINPKKKTKESPQIQIYSIDKELKQLILIQKIDNLSSSIEFIDFSTENFYLMFKDIENNISYITLTDMKKVDNIDTSHKIEWMNEGIKFTDYKRSLDLYYNEENRIIKMKKLFNKFLIATDILGTVRIFECNSNLSSYNKIYAQHLNIVNNCKISKNNKYLMTSSEKDNNIFIWKINLK